MKKTTQKTPTVQLLFETKTGTTKRVSYSISEQQVNQPLVSIKDVYVGKNLLLHITHNHLQTLLDLTDVSHVYVLGFDEHLAFVGVSIVGPKANAPFQLLNQSRFFLILSNEVKIDFGKLVGIVLV
ncbi:MAG: hypothetical protein CFE21_11715 [Bacteroidetes bacterium B1(2017)]|nr:MAG: hypothetical protein CFE21_11715 [Bacteroidetes bacterium B1(2017)]